jgi:hypothetical protein
MNGRYVDSSGDCKRDGKTQEDEEQNGMSYVQDEEVEMRRDEASVQSVRAQRPLVPGVPTRN